MNRAAGFIVQRSSLIVRDSMTDQQKTFFSKLKRGLFMTHTEIIEKVKESMTPDLPINQSAIDSLEEGLLGADVGAELTAALVARLEERVRQENIRNIDRLTAVLREETRTLIPEREAGGIDVDRDTFRAAAIEQLQMWADRIGVPMIKHKAGSDPGAVAHDAVAAAKSRGTDIVIIDTAGRLHNKSHLMQELSKVRRVIEKELPGAPHETLLVIDGTTGQNGVNQAEAFLKATNVTGMVVTKLDGTAKGGVILSIMRQFDIPVKFIGVGESADDLIPFDPNAYVETLFE